MKYFDYKEYIWTIRLYIDKVIGFPRLAYRHIKWTWQRAWRGWDDTMTWSIDYWLSETMPKLIEKMRQHKGYPGILITEDIAKLPQDEIDKICIEKWNIILDDIVAGFNAAIQISDGGGPAWDEYFDECHKLYGDYHDWCSSESSKLRDEVWVRLNMDEKIKLEQERLFVIYNKGMDLFKEYYFNLW